MTDTKTADFERGWDDVDTDEIDIDETSDVATFCPNATLFAIAAGKIAEAIAALGLQAHTDISRDGLIFVHVIVDSKIELTIRIESLDPATIVNQIGVVPHQSFLIDVVLDTLRVLEAELAMN